MGSDAGFDGETHLFCQHPRLSALPLDLFQVVTSFQEMEGRIAALPEELDRGDALEVFVEAYLQTHPLFQVKDLWLVGQVPAEVRRLLNLPRDQKGIDGVFRTRSGELVPYQVKFRIGRPPVTVREVATFLGLTERANDRMLISNSDRYAGDIENRDHLRILTGTYFDSLTRDELAAISGWLKGRPARPDRATPRPHQQSAIEDITATLATDDRTTAVMACGTGKTLVGLRVAEAMQTRSVLVLVPSLALLSQALADWSRDTVWGDRFEYLCVCSDPSVSQAADQWTLRSTEAPFPVQTQPKVVRTFLSRPARGKVRVVFSTYQSAPIVAKGMPRCCTFDLAIFDEAHKTAGPHRGTFAFALQDTRLRVRKRLFLTATPRRIDCRNKDRQGDFRVVSMEDTAVYGRRAHELSFADAVARGIICDYGVVVATVDPTEIPAAAIKHGITLVKGDKHATRWVAMQIAVAKAIHATGARKVITFHSRVDQAKHFASDTPKGIQSFLSGFRVGHVKGADPVAVRKEVLAGFKENRKQLVANARCLTEGVDLPAVDMVVFSNPRKSKVDIIQAIGRAVRKPRGTNKSIGYVVLPLLLPPHRASNIEEACRGTDWEPLVEVLSALRDHDSRLDNSIRQQQRALGAEMTFNPRDVCDRVQVLGAEVTVDALRTHIGAMLVKALGVPWDQWFGRAMAFRTSHGHLSIDRADRGNGDLARWMDKQRQLRRRGLLSADRIDQLDSLGFDWAPRDRTWEPMMAALVAFKEKYGHCRVPFAYAANPQLGVWLDGRRQAQKRGKLSADRAAILENLGVEWDTKDAAWRRACAVLEAYREREGHCDVPYAHSEGVALGAWLEKQRRDRSRGRLLPERLATLDALGVRWEQTKDSQWEAQFRRLASFKADNGHCLVPRNHPGRPSLGGWLTNQRLAFKRGTLPEERRLRLESLGVVWDVVDAAWDRSYEALVAFRRQKGHCDVPKGLGPLGHWLQNQRMSFKRGKLTPDQIQRLESIGANWDPHEAKWRGHYAELQAFASRYGNCSVPQTGGADDGLGKWLNRQRVLYRKGKLTADRIGLLEKVGVVWDPFDQLWESFFSRVVAFREQHGHCDIPYKDTSGKSSLRGWLDRQRNLQRAGRLSASRFSRLALLGVTWY
jgi:superfamily II DNA or RNA helicase